MKQIKRIFMAIVLICVCNTHNCFAAQIIISCAATEPPCDTGCHEDPDTGFCVSDQLTPIVEDDPCWQYTGGMACLDSAETCYWNDIGGGNHVCSATQIESCHDIAAISVQLPRQTCNDATVGGQQCEWTTSAGGLCRNKTTTVTCCNGTTASSVSACPTCNTCAAITNTSMCTTYHTSTLDCILENGSCRDKTCADLSQSNCTTYNTNWHCMWDSMSGCRTCNEYEYYDTTNKKCKQCASADDPRNVNDYARYTDGYHNYWSYRFAETNATSRQQCYAKYPSGPVSSVTIANSSNCSNASTTGKMFYQTANACRVTEATCQNGYYFNPTNGANTCLPCTNNANGNGIFTGPGNKKGEDPIGTTVSTICPIKCPINKTGPAYYETSAKTCETCKNAGANGRPNGYADAVWLVTDTNQTNGGYCGWRITCQQNYEWRHNTNDMIGNCYACPAHYHTDQAYIVYAYPNAADGNTTGEAYCSIDYDNTANADSTRCDVNSQYSHRTYPTCQPDIYTIALVTEFPTGSAHNDVPQLQYIYEQYASKLCYGNTSGTETICTSTQPTTNSHQSNTSFTCCDSGFYTSATPSCETCIGATSETAHEQSPANKLTIIPQSTQQFMGYWTKNTDRTWKAKVIDENGTLTSNTMFAVDNTLYARWSDTGTSYTLKLKDTDNNEYLTQSCSGSICTLSTNNSNKMYQIATSSYTLGNNFVVNNVTMGKFYQDGNSVKFEIASGGLAAIDSATNTLTLTVGQKCAEGYYCQNLIATECPGQTTTEGTGATSVCQCTYFKMSTQVKDSFTSTNNKTSAPLSKVLLYKDIRKSYINSSSSTTLCN